MYSRIFCRTVGAVLGVGGALLFSFDGTAVAATVTVQVGVSGTARPGSKGPVGKNGYTYPSFIYVPAVVSIHPGDTVQWIWAASPHSTTSGLPGSPSGLWDSGTHNAGFTFTHVFPNSGTFPYYCRVHGVCCGMTGSVIVTAATPTPTPTPVPTVTFLGNISTRLDVETGDNVMIGGFIVTGTQPKKVIVRGIGPSLGTLGVAGALADPVLELHEPDGTVVTNDNWKDTQEAEIMATTLAPSNDLESAIVETLNPGAYTAIVSGKNGGTGIGLVEAYDLDSTVDSKLANISTRGLVQTGDNVMIGGFIVLGPNPQNVIVRAIGPSLASTVAGALADPMLELHDSNGTVLASNDNWRDTQEAQITATGLAPANNAESAIVMTLPSSLTGIGYTAIVTGVNGTTGVALVDVYTLP